MATFVISKRFNDEYKFVFASRKGKTIFTSLSYELKFECQESIELLIDKIKEVQFVKLKSSKGIYSFKLLLDGKHLATSRKYTTELRLEKGIKEIVLYGYKAEILDFSNGDIIFEG